MPSCVEEEEIRLFFHVVSHEGWFIAYMVTNILEKTTPKGQQAASDGVDLDIPWEQHKGVNQFWNGGSQEAVYENTMDHSRCGRNG